MPRRPTSASGAQTAVARAPSAATATAPRRGCPAVAQTRCRGWRCSSVADPRVEPGGNQIDQDVQDDEYDRIEEDQVLHHEHVALAHRDRHGIAEAGRAEGALHRN